MKMIFSKIFADGFAPLRCARNDTRRQNQGVTLAEALFAVIFYILVITGCFVAFQVGSSSWQTNSTQVEIQQELRKAMDWLIEDLRQSGGSTVTDVLADGTWKTTLTFKKSAGGGSGSNSWSATLQYSLGGSDGNQLLRNDSSTSQVIAQNIQSFQARRQASTPDIVEITLQGQKNTANGRTITISSQCKVEMRN
jgi:Tfp pilus assembly protein PilW